MAKDYNTAAGIIEAIGAARVKAAMGLRSDEIIRRYKVNNMMPPAWFDFCEKATGQKLDRALFGFKNEARP